MLGGRMAGPIRGRPPRRFRRRRSLLTPSRRRWWLVGVLAVAAFTVTASLLYRGEGKGNRRFATAPHANSKAGNSFAYPPGWTLEEKGPAVTVTSPGQGASVTFRPGPRGGPRRSALRLVSDLDTEYRRLSLTGFQLAEADGNPAVAFTGSAVSGRGDPIRVEAISVAGPERNYAVVIVLSPDADPAESLPPVEETVSSFRLTP